MAIRIEGTVALVTGANRGIGRALTVALLEGGAKKVYAAARDPKSVQDLVKKYGTRLAVVKLDVTKPAEITEVAAVATDVQLLVNNAGIATNFNAVFTAAGLVEAGRREVETNVFGPLALTQAFAPILARNGGGGVVNVNSVVGFVSFPVLITYSASKAALHSITQATRAHLKPQGTYVAGVHPGPVDTDMGSGLEMEKASPESVADAIIEGIEAGDEEIFPDPVAREIGKAYFADPKAVERHVTQPTQAAVA